MWFCRSSGIHETVVIENGFNYVDPINMIFSAQWRGENKCVFIVIMLKWVLESTSINLVWKTYM